METNVNKKIEELEKKIDEVYISIEKIRKYMLWTAIVTIVIIVLPLIGLIFIIPSFISNYVDTINTLGI